jgi:hypothetical protein
MLYGDTTGKETKHDSTYMQGVHYPAVHILQGYSLDIHHSLHADIHKVKLCFCGWSKIGYKNDENYATWKICYLRNMEVGCNL